MKKVFLSQKLFEGVEKSKYLTYSFIKFGQWFDSLPLILEIEEREVAKCLCELDK